MPRNKICDIRKSMRKIEERETGISKFCRFVEEEKCLVSSCPCMTLIYNCTSASGEDTVNLLDSGIRHYFCIFSIGRRGHFGERFIASLV